MTAESLPAVLRAPFPGLRPFMAEDADLFFGRDREIEDVLDRLAAFRFVSVVGVSGSGKSSLVRAGVIPVLRSGIAEGLSGRWRIATVRPGGGPIAGLREELRVHFPDLVSPEWPDTSYGLLDILRQRLSPAEGFLLVIDQFEELFRFRRQSLVRDGGNEAALFVNLILNVISQRECPAYVVLTMRSDYLGDCAQFGGLPEAINMSPYLVPRLSHNQRREAIERPLESLGIGIAPQLVQTLLNESSDDPDDLPVLQHALMRTWEHWRRREDAKLLLTVDDYRAIGTVKDALSLHADEAHREILTKYGDRGEAALRRLFQRLTERDAEGREVRRPASLVELASVSEAPVETVRAIVDIFRQDGRSFLTPYSGEIDENTLIDVSHECLLRRWTRLRVEWMPEEDESRRIYLRLADRAEESVVKLDGSLAPRFPYEFEDLLSGVLLQRAIDWWKRRKPTDVWASRYRPDFPLAEAYLHTSQTRNAQTLVSVWDDAAELVRKLTGALDTFDWNNVDRLCGELTARVKTAGEPMPAKMARQILSSLRRKRRFSNVETVADGMIRAGENRAEVLRFYAQALLEQGKLPAARHVLDSILADEFASKTDKAEARSMVARIYKQQYVDAKPPRTKSVQKNLALAVYNYYDVYRSDPENNLWTGVNVVALLARATRDQVAISGVPEFKQIAEDVEATLMRREGDDVFWTYAVACELAIALGRFDEAAEHLRRYVARSEIDAFECGSLLRQLTDVWQLDDGNEPGATLLPLLRAALLRRAGGNIELASLDPGHAQASRSSRFEAVFGVDRFQTLNWYKIGLERSRSVARIENLMGQPIGTGFLVNSADFFPEREREIILMTCTQVIDFKRRSLTRVHFTVLDRRFNFGEVIWSSPVDSLDVSFLSLQNIDHYLDFPGFPIARRSVQSASPPPRLYIIGHPGGRDISISDGLLVATDGKRMHYRVPTDSGSSGSPICDADNWSVVGIHHASSRHMPRLDGKAGTYEAQEGITIESIRAAIREMK